MQERTPVTTATRTPIVVNPVAGRGRGLEVAAALVQRLQAAGMSPELRPTEGPRHAIDLAAEVGAVADQLIVVGGDGTLRECAEGLGARGEVVELGFVPLGNANVVARELGIPLVPERAIEVAVGGRARRLDTLRANGRYALAMVGVGYDGRVTRWVDAARARSPWSRWYRWHADSLYAVLGIAALLGRRAPRLELVADGERASRTFAGAVVCNVETYAKGWAVTPGADPSDGRLDWVGRASERPDRMLAALLAARARRALPARAADYGRARAVEIVGEGPLAWQLDGDPMPSESRILVVVGPPIHVRAPTGS